MYDNTMRMRALKLLATGLSVSEVSRRTGVSRAAIREWRDNPAVLEPKMHARCFRCSDPPGEPATPRAYSYLLGQYLGDGCISHAGDGSKGVWALRISCADSWPGVMAECAAAMERVLPNRVFYAPSVGCTMVTSTSKHWPCLFPQHAPGKKHLRKIELDPWQQDIVDDHPDEFLRGLFHSDGCRIVNRIRRPFPDGTDRWYEYPRYMFTNESSDIRELAGASLDRLGIAWRYSRRNTISVAKRDAVAKLDTFVGPKY